MWGRRSLLRVLVLCAAIIGLAGCPNPFGPEDGGNVFVENLTAHAIQVHAGLYDEVDFTSSVAQVSTGTLTSGASDGTIEFPVGTPFNIWYTYTNPAGGNVWVRLVDDANELSWFFLDEGSDYVLRLGVGIDGEEYEFYEIVQGANIALPPVISPDGGVFTSSVLVAISSPTSGANVYYTTDGSTPSTNSTLYTGPFTLTESTTVRAIASGGGFATSSDTLAFFTVTGGGGGGGDTTPPVVTEFTVRSPAYAPTVEITSLTGTDDSSIWYWLVTESSTPPELGDSGWRSSPPTEFEVSSAGPTTLYAWARDSSENISVATAASTLALTVNTPALADIAVVHTGRSIYEVAVGDVNNDGRDDVAAVDVFPSSVYVYLQQNDADGGLNDAIDLAAPAGGDAITDIEIGDVNGDTRDDIVIVSRYGNYIGWYLQNVSGGLDPVVTQAGDFSDDYYLLQVGDVTGDGRDDVVTLLWDDFDDLTLHVYVQSGAGAIATTPVVYEVLHGGKGDLRLADVSNDGKLDVVVTSGQGFEPSMSVLVQQGDGTLAAPVTYSVDRVDPTDTSTAVDGVAIGDVNNDGKNEVVLPNGWYPDEAVLSIFEQGASPGPLDSTHVDVPSEGGPAELVIADFNNDGRDDIGVELEYSKDFTIYLQQADGSFVREKVYGVNKNTNEHRVGDFNNDGLPDVVTGDLSELLLFLSN